MPNTKITKDRISQHLQYSKKLYILGTIVAILVASLVFDVTRHTPSGIELIQIALVDSYCDTAKLENDLPGLLESAKERNSAVEEVNFLSVAYSGSSTDDYYGAQVYMVQVYAGDNDIWVQSEALTKEMAASGAVLPLETLDGFEEFTKAHPDVTVLWLDEAGYTAPADDEEETAAAIPQHAYAIDASSLLGFNQRGAYDIRGKYIMLSISAQNCDEVFGTVSDIFSVFTPAAAEDAANG